MKIGVVFDDSLDNPDGVQQYILTLGSWLIGQGHDVHYLVGQTTRSDIANIHSLSRNIKVRFNKNRLSIPLPVSSNKLRSFLEVESFDILHVQLPYSPQFAARVIAAAPKQTAIVGTFHILPFGKLQQQGTKLLRAMIARSLRRFDAVVAVSPAAQDFARQAMGLESVVVPNAVDLKRFAQKTDIKTNIKATRNTKRPLQDEDARQANVVFLGRLVPRKGCLQLLRALVELDTQSKLENISVTIAGSGPQASRLHKFALSNKLDMVKFVGQQTEDQKSDLLASADIVVLPSLAGESFGIVVVEAIAAGSAVIIGGDNPGYRYVLAATPQTIVDPRNVVAFAQKIDALASDVVLRKKYRELQQKHIQQFDIATVGKQIVAIYDEAFQKHGKV